MYKKAIVTFLDILGFRQIVADSNSGKINSILDIVKRAATPQKIDGLLFDQEDIVFYNPETIVFSDSIVRVRRIDSDENLKYPIGLMFNELLDIVHAQAGLIDFGILIRGGIAFGDISIDENRIFGPALIRAYDLESHFAKYPRLVLDPLLLKEYKENKLLKKHGHTYEQDSEHVKGLIRQADDGLWFVDYARAVKTELDEPKMYLIFLRRHRDLILNASSKFKELNKEMEKYVWLANYHNALIREINEEWYSHYNLKRENLLIHTKDLPALQTIDS